MCGICGILSRKNQADPQTLRRMTGLLAHRGPDAEGYHLTGMAALGHRRLSVIDLPGGAQPLANEDGTIHVVFNGEIYNFQELRKDLVARGHVFRTNSDTEVIVHQYEEDGLDCVKKFNGMFAFAVLDGKTRRLMLARDRLGIKPLYYCPAGDEFIFASELRPLLSALPEIPSLDHAALWAYLAIRYTPAPATLFQGVFKLEPGRVLTLDESGVRIHRYWEPPAEAEPLTGKAAEEAIRELVDDAVRLRLIADVPLGAFLSGGLDSTALVATMRKFKGEGLQTFSVDFHAEAGADYVNETRWSTLAAQTFATDHHTLTVSAADAVAALPTVAQRLDDLVSDPAVIPTYLISRFAREQVTVVLTGEGGDELFAGYQRYRLGHLARWYQPIPAVLRHLLFEAPAARLPHLRRVRKGLQALGAPTPAARQLEWLITLSPQLSDQLIGSGRDGRDLIDRAFAPAFAGQRGTYDLDRVLRCDLGSWLPDDLLTKVDRASMAVGLEARVPYLDHRLVELALRIPPREKAGLFQSKIIMKRALADRTPAAIVARPKAGFTLPLDEWFNRELREMVDDLLAPSRIQREGVFDPAAVQALLAEHRSGRERQGHQLFSLLLFQLWRDSIKQIPGPSGAGAGP